MARFPFKQKKINENTLLREFDANVNNEELIWHRDERDRQIIVVESDGWQLQMDNNLPVALLEGQTYQISAGEYHRVIKGRGKLLVVVKEND